MQDPFIIIMHALQSHVSTYARAHSRAATSRSWLECAMARNTARVLQGHVRDAVPTALKDE
jgi:hypothetical protein